MLIDEQVVGLLVAEAGIDPSLLRGDALLQQDLGLDSLALTEVLLALEDDLAISIPDPVQAELRTLDDLVTVVAAQLGHVSGGTVRPAAG